jgi:hypothetical protein
MTARNSRTASQEETGAAALTPLNLFADLPRRQLALMAQSASAVLRGAEAMRKVQQQTAHRASAQHEQAAQRLLGPCDAQELLGIQAELLRFTLQETAQYWQQLATAALKVQSDLAGSAGGAVLDGSAEPTLDSLQKAFAASLNGSATAAAAAH